MDTEIYQLNYFIYCNETTGTNILMKFSQKLILPSLDLTSHYKLSVTSALLSAVK